MKSLLGMTKPHWNAASSPSLVSSNPGGGSRWRLKYLGSFHSQERPRWAPPSRLLPGPALTAVCIWGGNQGFLSQPLYLSVFKINESKNLWFLQIFMHFLSKRTWGSVSTILPLLPLHYLHPALWQTIILIFKSWMCIFPSLDLTRNSSFSAFSYGFYVGP